MADLEMIRTVQFEAGQRWKQLKSDRDSAFAKIATGHSPDTPERQLKAAERVLQIAPRLLSETLEARSNHLDTWLSGIGIERIVGATTDFESPAFLEVGLAVGRAVGLVTVTSPSGGGTFNGTGFLVAPGVILTNHHVIRDEAEALRATVTFDYQDDAYGRPLPPTMFSLAPSRLFISNKSLDCTFAAVGDQLKGTFGIDEFGWLPLVGAEGKVEVKDPINVIQHPEGKSKQWVVRENRLILLPQLTQYRDPNVYAHYTADTLKGTSGAPALSRFWEVFALHHSAVPDVDEHGNILDLDGKPYHGIDDNRVKWVGNEGIRVSALVRFLKEQQSVQVRTGARLLASILEATRPDYIALATEAKGRHENGQLQPAYPQVSEEREVAAMRSRITFQLPLTITIELDGNVATAAAPPGSGLVRNQKPSERRKTAIHPPPPSPAPSERAHAKAIEALETARSRKYYEKERDWEERDAYYEGVSDEAHTPEERFEALHDLLTSTHTHAPRYAPAKALYPWIDLHQDGRRLVIKSIYSGSIFDAEKFIEEALWIEERREALRQSIVVSETFGSLSDEQLEEMLEAQQPYNCEHVVPQSWFGKEEPMRGDLHHLFACESDCNSFRGNHAYFDFPQFEEAYREFCGMRENNQFEPSVGKGTVARATLYYLVRYPKSISFRLSKMTMERVEILLRWHSADPPSTYEFHRNQAIFEVQGNRNPFIDHPDWAARTAFSGAL